MTISPITLSSITATNAATAVTQAQNSQATQATGNADPGDRTRLSKMAELMSKLSDLESSDPAKAKQVLSKVASALADQASSTGDAHLQQLADKFTAAANTGDLSSLKPQGHGHHHHPAAAAATGAPPASVDPTAAAATGKTASYTQNGSDPMAQVEAILGDALAGVGA